MTASAPIRVMVVDDHSMVRRGLAAILKVRPDLVLVGEACCGRDALEICRRVRPDVVLMDLVMPDMDGTAATRLLREHCPEVQVIALTSFAEKQLVEGALAAGAIGYLLKNVSAGELAEAIRSAHAGRPTMAPEIMQALLQAERLETLARDIIDAPPGLASLKQSLRTHVPPMLPGSAVEIHIFPSETALQFPADAQPAPEAFWAWVRGATEAFVVSPGTPLPWSPGEVGVENLLLVPVIGVENRGTAGGIRIVPPPGEDVHTHLLPLARALAAQISSALHAAQVYAQNLEQQRLTRELAMAGQIQSSFLPTALPKIDGWDFAATLRPARETAGDFYDLIPLPDGRLGLVIADVADKGMGAALFMALCRTLLRTYATDPGGGSPAAVLTAANGRILSDTKAGVFVTVFFGILDPRTGQLEYANAGHNPPLLLHHCDATSLTPLERTGMALGAVAGAAWQNERVQLQPNDLLLLYTDGVTEAQDRGGSLFGAPRLLETLCNARHAPALDIQASLLSAVDAFTGDAPQSDDITLVVVARLS